VAAMDEDTIAALSIPRPTRGVAGAGAAAGGADDAADLSSLMLSIRTGSLSAAELERCIAELVVHRSALLARHGAMNRVLLRGFVDALLREEVKKLMAALESTVHLSALKSLLDAGDADANGGVAAAGAHRARTSVHPTPPPSLPSSTPGSGTGTASDAESKVESAQPTPTGWFSEAGAATRHVSSASEASQALLPDLRERGGRKRPHPAQSGQRSRADSSDAESGRASRHVAMAAQATTECLPLPVTLQARPSAALGRAEDSPSSRDGVSSSSGTDGATSADVKGEEAGDSVGMDVGAMAVGGSVDSGVGHPAKRQRKLESGAPAALQLPTRPPRVHFPDSLASASSAMVALGVSSGVGASSGHMVGVPAVHVSTSSMSSASMAWGSAAETGAGAGAAAAAMPSMEALQAQSKTLLPRLLSKELFRDLERQWSTLLSRRWGSKEAVRETRLAVWDALSTTLSRFRAHPGAATTPEPLEPPPEVMQAASGGGGSVGSGMRGARGGVALTRMSVGSEEDLHVLDRFGDMLRDCARCYRLEEVAAMHTATALDNYAIVSCLDFDVTGQYFATGEIANRVRVFDYATVMSSTVEAHAPILSFEESQKISCIDWNPLTRNLLTAVGHAGVVVVHDISAARVVGNFVAHSRRAWSVDSSPFTASVFATGADDCTTKLWSTTSPTPVMVLEGRASVCCVQFNPFKEHEMAIGCADRRAYVYDIRNTRHALSSARGHSHAVAFVRFGAPTTLISSSTDSTVRYWDVSSSHASCLNTHSGHVNSKNFLGLTHSGTFTATGSEDGRVVVYHQAVRRPLLAHSFGVINPLSGETEGAGEVHLRSGSSSVGTRSERSTSHGDEASLSSFSSVNSSSSSTKHFVSALCWRPRAAQETLVAANSQGSIKVFTLRPPTSH